jgi:hypothetical protein
MRVSSILLLIPQAIAVVIPSSIPTSSLLNGIFHLTTCTPSNRSAILYYISQPTSYPTYTTPYSTYIFDTPMSWLGASLGVKMMDRTFGVRIDSASNSSQAEDKVGRATLEDLDCFPGYYIWNCFKGSGAVVNGGGDAVLGECVGEYYCTWVSFRFGIMGE